MLIIVYLKMKQTEQLLIKYLTYFYFSSLQDSEYLIYLKLIFKQTASRDKINIIKKCRLSQR